MPASFKFHTEISRFVQHYEVNDKKTKITFYIFHNEKNCMKSCLCKKINKKVGSNPYYIVFIEYQTYVNKIFIFLT